jgi:hypothetical protein
MQSIYLNQSTKLSTGFVDSIEHRDDEPDHAVFQLTHHDFQ